MFMGVGDLGPEEAPEAHRYFHRSSAFYRFDVSVPRSIALGMVLAIAIVVSAPQAQAGIRVDRSFGRAGTATPSLPPTWESSGFSELIAQADGGALVRFGPVAVNSYVGPGMRRFLADGSLDPGYSAPAPPSSRARLRLPDGKLLYTETTPNGGEEAVVRLNPDGTRDKTFGNEGAGSALPFLASAISVGPSGAILVAGAVDKSYTGMHGSPSVSLVETVVARLSDKGRLDPSFAATGVANLHDLGGIEGLPREIQEGSDGRVWLSVRTRPENDDALVGMTSAGALNPEFGAGSRVDPGGTIAAFHPLPDGRVEAAVNRQSKRQTGFAQVENLFLLAYRPDGQIDPGFGSAKSPTIESGRATTALWGSDGSALLGVSTTTVGPACRGFYNACSATPTLARLSSDGRLDRSFGSAGTLALDAMQGPDDFAGIGSLALRPGGGYLAAGSSGLQAFLARITEGGELAGDFGRDGLVTEAVRRNSRTFADAVAADRRGRIIVAASGNSNAISSFERPGLLFRLRPNGSLDQGFAGGRAVLALPAGVTALAVDHAGRSIVLLGGSTVERITAKGGVDRSFGQSGFVFLHPHLTSMIALSDGSVLLAGADGRSAAIVRLDPSGRLDRSFDSGGEARLAFRQRGTCRARALAPQGGGRIVVAGECGGTRHRKTMFVGRLQPDGKPEPSFSRRSRLAGLPGRSGATAIASQRGKVLVGAVLMRGKRRSELLVRLDRDGRRDRSFARGGVARVVVPTPQKLGVNWCGSKDETASILPLDKRILLVHDGAGAPVLAFRQDGRRDRALNSNSIAPGRQVAPGCFPGPLGARQEDSAVIAWSQPAGPTWSVSLQRLGSR
jgi:uncharacterized delta-60 repeat protein